LAGEFHIRFEDLTKAIPLDVDGDGVITDEEVATLKPQIDAYLAARLRFHDSAGSHAPVPGELDFFGPEKARQMKLHFTVPQIDPPPDLLDVEYVFLYDDVDADHQPMLLQKSNTRMRLDYNEWFVSLVFGTGAERQVVDLQPPGIGRLIPEFIRYGLFQILLSPIHLAIALIVLIPCLRIRPADAPVPALSRVAVDAGRTALIFAAGFGAGLLLRSTLNYRPTDPQNVTLLGMALLVAALTSLVAAGSIWRWIAVFVAAAICGGIVNDYSSLVGLNKGLVEIVIPGFAVGLFAGLCLLAAAILPAAHLLVGPSGPARSAIRTGGATIALGAAAFVLFRVVF
jgi:hypothetical protein